MGWCIASDAYWRREGDDVLVVSSASALRLNAASAELFFRLISGEPPASVTHGTALDELATMLEAEGVLVRGDCTADQQRNYIAHIDRA